jgi:hypothetical protein
MNLKNDHNDLLKTDKRDNESRDLYGQTSFSPFVRFSESNVKQTEKEGESFCDLLKIQRGE